MRLFNPLGPSTFPRDGKLILDFDKTISMFHVSEECSSEDDIKLSLLAPLLREIILGAHEIGNEIWICSNSKFPKTIRMYLDKMLNGDSIKYIPDEHVKTGRGYADSKTEVLESIVEGMENKALALFVDDSAGNCEVATKLGLSIIIAILSLHEAQRAYADFCKDPNGYYEKDKEILDQISKRREKPFILKPLDQPKTRLQKLSAQHKLTTLQFKPRIRCEAGSSDERVKSPQTTPPIKVK